LDWRSFSLFTARMTNADILAKVLILLNHDLDARKCWNTINFYATETPVNACFNHDKFGYRRRNAWAMFHEHVMMATYWFRGTIDNIGPKSRAMNRERFIRAGITTAEQWITHPSLLIAHDIPTADPSVEGGPKDFFMASVWQIYITRHERQAVSCFRSFCALIGESK